MLDQHLDPYAVLELPPDATVEEVRAAYLDQAKIWHPDRYAHEPARLRLKAEERLKAVNAAYDVLRRSNLPSSAPAVPDTAETLLPMDFGGVWGYCGRDGRMVIAPEFKAARPFAEGLAAVVCDSRWGFIDATGRYRVNPLYEDAGDYAEGLAAVAQRGRWGYIDTTGRYMIAPRFSRALPFREGWADVLMGARWGKVNRAGEVYFAMAAAAAAAIG